MFERILVVCVGNICRSPTAELMLRAALPDRDIGSAGLGALVGHDMDKQARLVAEAAGLDCPVHEARQITREMCHAADLILVMEARHREGVTQLCPEARGKTFLLAQGLQPSDIADPYRKSAMVFEQIFKQLQQASQAWVQRLSR
ncbi:MAG: low molecular weight protein-tyrosine-phosphatase [Pseudomonadota bacterium]